MNPLSLTEAVSGHVEELLDSSPSPDPEIDQVAAAVLKGAAVVDTVAVEGRRLGADTGNLVRGEQLFQLLAERFGDPLTLSKQCTHLAARPIQPRFIYGADLSRAFCKPCFSQHLGPDNKTLDAYTASDCCDACGIAAEEYRVGNLSNGIVTYAIRTCDACFNGVS